MDAVVTIKLTPQEFDTLRESVAHYRDRCREYMLDASLDAKSRGMCAEEIVKANDLLGKMQ